jgi:aminoglycoside phosphotransferase (APT) family kinase protein
VQNALVANGYPAAKSQILCTDTSILGGVFFTMDFLPGKPMAIARVENVPKLLGRTHAALHRIDPKLLIKSFAEQGIDESRCLAGYRLGQLKERASDFPWVLSAVDWLLENRPPDPDQLTVCHGDFHPLNILVQDGVVTGVLDWVHFLIADPVLDLAATIVLITIPVKHLAPKAGIDFSSVDWRLFEQLYLDAYQAEIPLDRSHLDYYRAMRCVYALVEGAEGMAFWRNPSILKDLLECIHSVTGIPIRLGPPLSD